MSDTFVFLVQFCQNQCQKDSTINNSNYFPKMKYCITNKNVSKKYCNLLRQFFLVSSMVCTV